MPNDRVTSECSVCATAFQVRFRYQVREDQGQFAYYCSAACLQQALGRARSCRCSVCGSSFRFEYPYQVAVTDSEKSFYCSPDCFRARGARQATVKRRVRRLAVFNHKGGTGKTTTAINVAAAFAEKGERVLLIDADGQGNVGAALGIRGEHTLYHVLVVGTPVSEAVVPVRTNLDVLTSNELLAAAELYIAGRPNRDRIMRERLGEACSAYDVVVIDCAPALSLMNQNVLVLADSVLVPVGCDYLSLVGVKQVLKTLKNVRDLLKHPVDLMGVVPTFYDTRNRICRDALKTLQDRFGERCLAPVRVNTKLKEAPTVKQTIFEYAPESHGAEDYTRVVSHLLEHATDPSHDVAARSTDATHAQPALQASAQPLPADSASVVMTAPASERPQPSLGGA